MSLAANPLRSRSGYVYDEYKLVEDASNSVFALRNQVTPRGVRHLWQGMCSYISMCLKAHKGVALPALGTFDIGQAIEDRFTTYKRHRAAFSLLEGRFGGVSQERGRYRLLSRLPVAQLNFGAIAHQAGLHRTTAQRLLLEMLQRIATHVVSGTALQVALPSVGQLLKNRAGRVEFVWDPALVTALELGVRPETPAYSIASALPLQLPRASTRPATALPVPMPPEPACPARAATPALPPTGYAEALQLLLTLCKHADRLATGTVPRPQLERWLHTDARAAVAALDAPTLLDLLEPHTFGATGRSVQYSLFLQDLDRVNRARGAPHTGAAAHAEVLPAAQRWVPPPPPDSVGDALQRAAESASTVGGAAAPSPPASPPPPLPRPRGGARSPSPLGGVGRAASPVSTRPASPPCGGNHPLNNHYWQHLLPQRSRADYDDFNRFHFSRLRLQRDKRTAVAPKVGQEPLNVSEVGAWRAELEALSRPPSSGAPAAARAPSPMFAVDAPPPPAGVLLPRPPSSRPAEAGKAAHRGGDDPKAALALAGWGQQGQGDGAPAQASGSVREFVD